MLTRFAGALILPALIAFTPLEAAERKPPEAVSTEDLTRQTQQLVSDARKLDLVWWIPLEFWESVFAQDPSVSATRAAEIVEILRPYSMLAVVEADITPLGAVLFFENERVASGLTAMGNLGENMHFFVLPDVDSAGARLVSPHEFGTVEVKLGGRDSSSPVQLSVELPLDALFVPRVCPNGKPAHVTWTHCPWGGSKLAD